ncbi:MAG TPA: hypothetical protein VHW64_19895 [Nocardioides sp.]|uniref:hypothetical protein n=1 Tax=Nocardioides sp. TaxID=35761 RepID=UPI002E34E00D|nr:hypothetical protein [Nocardioides sp.]HEX3932959.1 hypothetical protein [Nocardioides sp.]
MTAIVGATFLYGTYDAMASGSGIQYQQSGADAPLLNSQRWTTQGEVVDHGCQASAPVLTLAPGQDSVEARVVGVDPSTCTFEWEQGTPQASTSSNDPVGSSVTQTDPPGTATPTAQPPATPLSLASPTSRRGMSAPGMSPMTTYSSSGNELAWFEDKAGIDLNKDQSLLSWAWNPQGCVTSSSGWAYWWWRSGDGWHMDANDNGIHRYCGYSNAWSRSDFHNSIFCLGYTTHTHYRGVNVEGSYSGALTGWVDNQWYNACLPLYFHEKLTRTTG